MQIRIVVHRRTTAAQQLESVLRELGHQVRLEEALPEQSLDPHELLMVDAREMRREFLRHLERVAARKTFAHILAFTHKEERTFRKLHLMQAGVDMIVPFDLQKLALHLRDALQELYGLPDEP